MLRGTVLVESEFPNYLLLDIWIGIRSYDLQMSDIRY